MKAIKALNMQLWFLTIGKILWKLQIKNNYSANKIYTCYSLFCKAVETFKCISLIQSKHFFLLHTLCFVWKVEILHLIVSTTSELRVWMRQQIIPVIRGICLSNWLNYINKSRYKAYTEIFLCVSLYHKGIEWFWKNWSHRS